MHGLQYSFIDPTTVSVVGYDIQSPLLPPAKAPRGGWRFSFYLQGHQIEIRKGRPHEVAKEVTRLLDLNEVLYTPAQLWLNLNIQWVGRAIEKYQKVRLPDLLAISRPNF